MRSRLRAAVALAVFSVSAITIGVASGSSPAGADDTTAPGVISSITVNSDDQLVISWSPNVPANVTLTPPENVWCTTSVGAPGPTATYGYVGYIDVSSPAVVGPPSEAGAFGSPVNLWCVIQENAVYNSGPDAGAGADWGDTAPCPVTPQAPGIGAVSEVVGSATITHADGSVTTAVSGSPIALGDIIQTSANGAISVAFADQTTLAMSENARLQVDQYVYNPTTQKGTSLFSFLQGAFVYVSGLIGKNNPGNENIEAPVGEIGIRGTEFIAQVTPDQSDVQMDLIEGEVGLTPSLGGGTTIMDAPETASFNGSSVSSPTPLTESTYEQLEAQLFPVIPTFEVSPVSLSPATPAMTYGPLTLQAVNLGMSTSPFTTTLKWKKVSLPKGLKLSSTGVLSGTLNKALTGGLSSVSVQVTESVTNVDGKQKVKTATTALATIPLSIVQSQPAVTSVRKNSGPSAGGTTVSIKGTSLQGASEVKFGTVDATSFAVNSAGSVVTASTPAEGAGPVDVTVIDPGGTSSTSPADVFTFTP